MKMEMERAYERRKKKKRKKDLDESFQNFP